MLVVLGIVRGSDDEEEEQEIRVLGFLGFWRGRGGE